MTLFLERLVLQEIDRLEDTTAMFDAHIRLMQKAQGALNYCELERRLRRINAKTYLLALPYNQVTGPSLEFSLVYPQPLFPTWSRIPKFAVWYERKGQDAARQRLKTSGLSPDNNLSNLNKAGVIIPATTQHEQYSLVRAPEIKGLNQTYEGLFETLEFYRVNSHLSSDFNPTLMYVIDRYLASTPDLKYTINEKVSSGYLQFYVIDKDPKRLLVNFPCSCAYIPKSNLILCDKRALVALSKWAVYGDSSERNTIWA